MGNTMTSLEIGNMPNLDVVFSISSKHPSLEGHFPGHPVVPAVVLLNEIESQLKQQYPSYHLSELTQAKFMQLVLPEQRIHLTTDMVAADDAEIRVKFTLMNQASQLCAKGSFLFLRSLGM